MTRGVVGGQTDSAQNQTALSIPGQWAGLPTAAMSEFTVRLYSKYRTLNLDEIYAIARRTEKEEF